MIVTSGAIARGTRILGLAGRPSAIAELQAASAVGQGGLYRAYDELLAGHGVIAAQVLLTFSDVSARTSYLNARQTLGTLLEWRAVPVVNENDTTATDEITFGDNDLLAAQVAILVGAGRLIILTNSDGLHTADRAPSRRRRSSSGSRTSRRSTRSRSPGRPRRTGREACARRWSPRTWRRRPGSRR